jgi:predicted dehydrogenase
MAELRFAALGAGFWASYQLAGWQEIEGARCIAIYNRTRQKAERLAEQFGIPNVYDDAQALLRNEHLDFLDIITSADTHRQYVELAAHHKLPVVCQKPLADSVEDAREMVAACQRAGVPLLVNENWRWQTPLRALKAVLDEGRVGRLFRGRIHYCNSFPVFDNQPFLKQLDRFILTDIGSHILDTARFLFGEASQLYCQASQVHPGIQGEDVATVMLKTIDGVTVTCEMSYASRMEHERFPQTYVVVEGDQGSVELGPDYWLRVTTANGTWARRYPPPRYGWVDPAYDVVHSSIVACQQNLFDALRGAATAETTAEDNLRTLQLVELAYESAQQGKAIGMTG